MASAERQEILDLPLESIYRVICDFEKYPEFVSGMKATRIVEKIDDSQKKVFFDIDMVKRVQYTVKIRESLAADKQTAQVDWSLVESDFLKVSNGLWVLKSLGPQKTEVKYRLEVEFNFSVPGFMLKGLIATSMPKAIEEFKNRALKLK